MMLNKIVTSLYVYKYSLFISYLDGTVEVSALPKFGPQYSRTNSKIKFVETIKENKSMIVGMQALQNVLFVATTNQLMNFELGVRDGFNSSLLPGGFYKDVPGCQKIILNNKKNILYVLTNERGIIALNIKNVNKPIYLNDIQTSVLNDIGEGGISGIDVMDDSIILSIRDRGIFRVFINEDNRAPELEREIQKIQLSDVQDVKYIKRTKYLYIVDTDRGFIILNTSNNNIEFEAVLPEGDTPKSIYPYFQFALIRGAKGVYMYSPRTKSISKILDEKIGPMDSYYNHFFYSQKGKIKLLILTSSGVSRAIEQFNREKIIQIDTIQI